MTVVLFLDSNEWGGNEIKRGEGENNKEGGEVVVLPQRRTWMKTESWRSCQLNVRLRGTGRWCCSWGREDTGEITTGPFRVNPHPSSRTTGSSSAFRQLTNFPQWWQRKYQRGVQHLTPVARPGFSLWDEELKENTSSCCLLNVSVAAVLFCTICWCVVVPADRPDHEKCERLFLPGSAAVLRPGSGEQSRSGQIWWRHTEGHIGCRHPKPQWRVELIAPLRVSHGAPTCTGSALSLSAAKESPAGVPLCPLPRRSHQHPQCPHRPGKEPGHEDEGGSQRRTDGTNWQKEIMGQEWRRDLWS